MSWKDVAADMSGMIELLLARLRSIEQRLNLLDEITADNESRLEDLEDDEE